MSRSLSNYSENSCKNQCREAYSVKSNSIINKDETNFASKTIEKRYNEEWERKVREETIPLTIMKTVFQSTIEKMELAVAMPSLTLYPESFPILTSDETDVIHDVRLYDINFYSKCVSQSASKNKRSRTDTERISCVTSGSKSTVYEVLKILNKYIDIFRTSFHYRRISIPSALFIHHIRYLLQEYALCKMYLTAEQAKSKELHYRELWRCQKESIRDIAISTTDLERQRANHKRMIENDVGRYKNNIVLIDEINKKCNENVADTITKYEKKQFILYKAWKHEENEMQLVSENVTDNLQLLKGTDVKMEQAIRRSRIESKLLAIITKYDTEIGSRYRMLEELGESYESNKLEKYALEEETKRQEKKYITSVEGRKDTGVIDFNERLDTFKQERSARIIQRWWRKVS